MPLISPKSPFVKIVQPLVINIRPNINLVRKKNKTGIYLYRSLMTDSYSVNFTLFNGKEHGAIIAPLMSGFWLVSESLSCSGQDFLLFRKNRDFFTPRTEFPLLGFPQGTQFVSDKY